MDQYPKDVGYIVGRPFKTTQGWSWPGEPAPEEVVRSTNLYAFISSGMVYPYVPEDGYAKLPPHVFSAVRTYQEVNGIIARGEAPITMEWTPPQKLVDAQAAIDAENDSREANQVISQVQAEAWTRKLEVSQISPRPIELPRDEIFVDAKKSEALKVAEQDEDGEIKEGTSTPVYHASDDDPVKPEFEDTDLTDQFEAAKEAATPSDTLTVNNESPAPVLAAQERADELGKTAEDTDEVPDFEEAAKQEDYSGLTVAELKDKLKERDLPTSGNKADLIARLEGGAQPDALPDSNVDTPVEVTEEPSDEVKEQIDDAEDRVEESREEGAEVAEAFEPEAHDAHDDEDQLIPATFTPVDDEDDPA